MPKLYIACWLTPDQAVQLDVGEGGEEPDALHMTLCCIGDLEELPDDAAALAERVLRVVSVFTPPIQGEISGVGRFMGATQDVLYASVDAPALPAFRQRLVDALELVGLPVDDSHGFSPHITLAYLDPDTALEPTLELELGLPLPITLRSVALCTPGRRHFTDDDVPLGVAKSGDPAVMRAIGEVADRVRPDDGYGAVAWDPETGTVFWQSADWTTRDEHTAAKEAFLAIDGVDYFECESEAALPAGMVVVRKESPAGDQVHIDSAEGMSVEFGDSQKKRRKRKVQMLKADDEHRIVYGIVLEPGVEDSQGDVCSSEDIELAAHRFLYTAKPIGIQHGAMAPDTVRPVESYIAPADFTIETPRGPEVVRKGSWVLAAHVPEEALWGAVKSGDFGGWSVAGTGIRTPVAAPVVKADQDQQRLIDRLLGAVEKMAGRASAPIEVNVPVTISDGAVQLMTSAPQVTIDKGAVQVNHRAGDIHVEPAAAPAPQISIIQPPAKPTSVRVEIGPDGTKRYVTE